MKSNPDNTEPAYKGSCKDLTVIARSGRESFKTIATGEVTSARCSWSLTLPRGTYTIDLVLDGRSILMREKSRPTYSVAPGNVSNASMKAVWPLYPTAVVKGRVDVGGVKTVSCSNTTVTVVHALRSFKRTNLTQQAGGWCAYHFNWVPHGAVTVSVSSTGASAAQNPPSQTATTQATSAVISTFAYPKYAVVRTRVRPSTYPAQNAALDCTPYDFVLKMDGVAVDTRPLKSSLGTECTGQTLPEKVQSGVPHSWELRKHGVVVQSETMTLGANQFLDKIVSGLP